MENNTKGIMASKTIWGAVIVVLSQIALLFGWDIGNTDGLAEQITGIIGGLIAIWGRVTAVRKIG